VPGSSPRESPGKPCVSFAAWDIEQTSKTVPLFWAKWEFGFDANGGLLLITTSFVMLNCLKNCRKLQAPYPWWVWWNFCHWQRLSL
jgi:hypothetical protein